MYINTTKPSYDFLYIYLHVRLRVRPLPDSAMTTVTDTLTGAD